LEPRLAIGHAGVPPCPGSPTEKTGTGAWSAVVVEDGTPQQIGIVFSIEKSATDRCADKWNSISMADMSVSNPVESGELVPPSALALSAASRLDS